MGGRFVDSANLLVLALMAKIDYNRTERLRLKVGFLQKGRQEELLLLPERRFGNVPKAVTRRVRKFQPVERLDALLLAALDAKSMKELPV